MNSPEPLSTKHPARRYYIKHSSTSRLPIARLSRQSNAEMRRLHITPASSSDKENRLNVRKQYLNKLLKRDKLKEEGNKCITPDRPRSGRWSALTKIMNAVNGLPEDDSDDSSDSSSDDDDDDDDDEVQVTVMSTSARSGQDRSKDPTAPKHPSPLSSKPVYNSDSPARLSYPHRGHSRSSLLHQKSFWHERYEEWTTWQNRPDFDSVYGGIYVSPPRRDSLSGPPRRGITAATSEEAECAGQQEIHNAALKPALFPRIGDLSALRDPYLINADQCFANFPLWTLTKMAWIFDADHRTTIIQPPGKKQLESASKSSREPTPALFSEIAATAEAEQDDASQSDMTLSALSSLSDVSMSSTSSKADVTLVDPDSSLTNDVNTSACNDILNPVSQIPVTDRAWETSWYARWEILLHQVKSAEYFKHGGSHTWLAASYPPSFAAEPLLTTGSATTERPRTGQIFCIDDEEDDYGEPLQNPAFRMGASLNPYAMFAQCENASTDNVESDDDVDLLQTRFEFATFESVVDGSDITHKNSGHKPIIGEKWSSLERASILNTPAPTATVPSDVNTGNSSIINRAESNSNQQPRTLDNTLIKALSGTLQV